MDNVFGKMRNWGLLGMILCLLVACQDDWSSENIPDLGQMVNLMGRLQQQNESRANDAGFVDGDRMGIYMVDYVNGQPGVLSPTDNRATNVLYTFNAAVNKWESATALYWKDKTTPADFYGYYPGVNYIENPSAYSFEVSYQQHSEPEEGEMSHYEASDFLWGKVSAVTPTTETIVLSYKHRMAGVSVKLVMGKNFTQTEWDKLSKQVQVDNTIRTASIDLAKGVPVAVGSVDKSIQMYAQSDGTYRAVVVPQKVDAEKTLMTITIDGYSYTHKLSTGMEYQSGKLHNFSITVNKNSNADGYQLSFCYDGITEWLNDEMSHSFTSNQYVIIHCPEQGALKQSVADAGYDFKTIENLKVTGTLTGSDFEFINKEMSALKHLNLKEVKVKDAYVYYDKVVEVEKNHWEWLTRQMDNAIPEKAFYQNKNLRSVLLPKGITHIGDNAFREMQLMYSTLEIPEGVTYIGESAFAYNRHNGVELILPLSLDSIDAYAFNDCDYRCELTLSDNIRYLGSESFNGTDNFYGTFQIPSKLTKLAVGAFCGMGSDGSIDGGIEIPQGIKEIPERAFAARWEAPISFKNRISLKMPNGVNKIGRGAFSHLRFNSLYFNDDLEEIGAEAFYDANIPFQITLPSQLKVIGIWAFLEAKIEGELVIPESCQTIGDAAFAGNHFTKITLPQNLEMIPSDCFSNLRELTYINIPKYVDYIGYHAFAGDVALQTIICLNPEPPRLGDGVFNEIPMDKVVLQVPEASVEKYRNAEGWKQFKNITPYHELAFNVPEIKTLDKGMTREGILRAEGAWEVAECPSWVTVSPTSGHAKANLTIKVAEQAKGAGTREGRIVFRLKDKDYTTYTTVKQISSDVTEDQTVVLQTASAGASNAVPLFIVGDGYDAEEIASGKYMEDMKAQMEHFFSIEPFKSYRKYFTVSTAIACSPESGLDGETRFESEFDESLRGNSEMVWQYACAHGEGISSAEEGDCTIMVLLNTSSTANHTDITHWNGRTVSWVGKSNDTYPFDQKSQVLTEVGGVALGKLAPEGVSHFPFIQACGCPGCNMLGTYHDMRNRGWYQNVSISSKMNNLPWTRYIFHEKYAKYVDMYEGAINHARGTYRSENMSIMGNTYIPYFNTISREMIVRRIMDCAGETFSLDHFIANDKIEIPE